MVAVICFRSTSRTGETVSSEPRCTLAKTIFEPVGSAAEHEPHVHPDVGSQPGPLDQPGVCFEVFQDTDERRIRCPPHGRGRPAETLTVSKPIPVKRCPGIDKELDECLLETSVES